MFSAMADQEIPLRPGLFGERREVDLKHHGLPGQDLLANRHDSEIIDDNFDNGSFQQLVLDSECGFPCMSIVACEDKRELDGNSLGVASHNFDFRVLDQSSYLFGLLAAFRYHLFPFCVVLQEDGELNGVGGRI